MCPNLPFEKNILTGFFYGVLRNRKLVERIFYCALKIRKSFDRFASLALKNRKRFDRFALRALQVRKSFDRFVLRILKIRSGLTLPFKNLYKLLKYLIPCLGLKPNSGLLSFLELVFMLPWAGVKLRTTVFLRVRIYIILGRNQTQEHKFF